MKTSFHISKVLKAFFRRLAALTVATTFSSTTLSASFFTTAAAVTAALASVGTSLAEDATPIEVDASSSISGSAYVKLGLNATSSDDLNLLFNLDIDNTLRFGAAVYVDGSDTSITGDINVSASSATITSSSPNYRLYGVYISTGSTSIAGNISVTNAYGSSFGIYTAKAPLSFDGDLSISAGTAIYYHLSNTMTWNGTGTVSLSGVIDVQAAGFELQSGHYVLCDTNASETILIADTTNDSLTIKAGARLTLAGATTVLSSSVDYSTGKTYNDNYLLSLTLDVENWTADMSPMLSIAKDCELIGLKQINIINLGSEVSDYSAYISDEGGALTGTVYYLYTGDSDSGCYAMAGEAAADTSSQSGYLYRISADYQDVESFSTDIIATTDFTDSAEKALGTALYITSDEAQKYSMGTLSSDVSMSASHAGASNAAYGVYVYGKVGEIAGNISVTSDGGKTIGLNMSHFDSSGADSVGTLSGNVTATGGATNIAINNDRDSDLSFADGVTITAGAGTSSAGNFYINSGSYALVSSDDFTLSTQNATDTVSIVGDIIMSDGTQNTTQDLTLDSGIYKISNNHADLGSTIAVSTLSINAGSQLVLTEDTQFIAIDSSTTLGTVSLVLNAGDSTTALLSITGDCSTVTGLDNGIKLYTTDQITDTSIYIDDANNALAGVSIYLYQTGSDEAYGLTQALTVTSSDTVEALYTNTSDEGLSYSLTLTSDIIFTDSSQEAAGIYNTGIMGTISSDMYLTSDSSYTGTYLYAIYNDGGTIASIQDCTLSVEGTGSANLYGIENDDNGTISSISDVTLDLSSSQQSINAILLKSSEITSITNSSITVSSGSSAYGIKTDSESSIGSISGLTLDITNTSSANEAYGITVMNASTIESMSDIDIKVASTKYEAYGVYISASSIGAISGSITVTADDEAYGIRLSAATAPLNFTDTTSISATGANENYALYSRGDVELTSLAADGTLAHAAVSLTGDIYVTSGSLNISSGDYSLLTGATITADKMSIGNDASLTLGGVIAFAVDSLTLNADLSNLGTILDLDNVSSLTGLDTITISLSEDDYDKWDSAYLSTLISDSNGYLDETSYIITNGDDTTLFGYVDATASMLPFSALLTITDEKDVELNDSIETVIDYDGNNGSVGAGLFNNGSSILLMTGDISVTTIQSHEKESGNTVYGLYNCGYSDTTDWEDHYAEIRRIEGDITLNGGDVNATGLHSGEYSSVGTIAGKITVTGSLTNYALFLDFAEAIQFDDEATLSASGGTSNYSIGSTCKLTVSTKGAYNEVTLTGDIIIANGANRKNLTFESGYYFLTGNITAADVSIAAGVSLSLMDDTTFTVDSLTLNAVGSKYTMLTVAAGTTVTGLDSIKIITGNTTTMDYSSIISADADSLNGIAFYFYETNTSDAYGLVRQVPSGSSGSAAAYTLSSGSLDMMILATLSFDALERLASVLYVNGSVDSISGSFTAVGVNEFTSSVGYGINNNLSNNSVNTINATIDVSMVDGLAYGINNASSASISSITDTIITVESTNNSAYGIANSGSASIGDISNITIVATSENERAYALCNNADTFFDSLSGSISATGALFSSAIYNESNAAITFNFSANTSLTASGAKAGSNLAIFSDAATTLTVEAGSDATITMMGDVYTGSRALSFSSGNYTWTEQVDSNGDSMQTTITAGELSITSDASLILCDNSSISVNSLTLDLTGGTVASSDLLSLTDNSSLTIGYSTITVLVNEAIYQAFIDNGDYSLDLIYDADLDEDALGIKDYSYYISYNGTLISVDYDQIAYGGISLIATEPWMSDSVYATMLDSDSNATTYDADMMVRISYENQTSGDEVLGGAALYNTADLAALTGTISVRANSNSGLVDEDNSLYAVYNTADLGDISVDITASNVMGTAYALYTTGDSLSFSRSSTLVATGASDSYAIYSSSTDGLSLSGDGASVALTGDVAVAAGSLELVSGNYSATDSSFIADDMVIESAASLTLVGDSSFVGYTLTLSVDDMATASPMLNVDAATTLTGLGMIDITLGADDYAAWDADYLDILIIDNNGYLDSMTYRITNGASTFLHAYLDAADAISSTCSLVTISESLDTLDYGIDAVINYDVADGNFGAGLYNYAVTEHCTISTIKGNISVTTNQQNNLATDNVVYGIYNVGYCDSVESEEYYASIGTITGNITVETGKVNAYGLYSGYLSNLGTIDCKITVSGVLTNYALFLDFDEDIQFDDGATLSASGGTSNYSIGSTCKLQLYTKGTYNEVTLTGDIIIANGTNRKDLTFVSGYYFLTGNITAADVSIEEKVSLTLLEDTTFTVDSLTLNVGSTTNTLLTVADGKSVTGLDSINIVVNNGDAETKTLDYSPYISDGGSSLDYMAYYFYEDGSADAYGLVKCIEAGLYYKDAYAINWTETSGSLDLTVQSTVVYHTGTVNSGSNEVATVLYNSADATLDSLAGDWSIELDDASDTRSGMIMNLINNEGTITSISANLTMVNNGSEAFAITNYGTISSIENSEIDVDNASLSVGIYTSGDNVTIGSISKTSVTVDSVNGDAAGIRNFSGSSIGSISDSSFTITGENAIGINNANGSSISSLSNVTISATANNGKAYTIDNGYNASMGSISGSFIAVGTESSYAFRNLSSDQTSLIFSDDTTLSATGASAGKNYAIYTSSDLALEGQDATISLTGDVKSTDALTFTSGIYKWAEQVDSSDASMTTIISAGAMTISSDASLVLSNNTSITVSSLTLDITGNAEATDLLKLTDDSTLNIGDSTITVLVDYNTYLAFGADDKYSLDLIYDDDMDESLVGVDGYSFIISCEGCDDIYVDYDQIAYGFTFIYATESWLTDEPYAVKLDDSYNGQNYEIEVEEVMSFAYQVGDTNYSAAALYNEADLLSLTGSISITNDEDKGGAESEHNFAYAVYSLGDIDSMEASINISNTFGNAVGIYNEGTMSVNVDSISASGSLISCAIWNNSVETLDFAKDTTLSATGGSTANYAIYSDSDLSMTSVGKVTMQGDLSANGSISLSSGSYTFDNGSATTTITADNMSIAAGASLTLSGEVNFAFSDGTLTLYVTDLSATSLDLSAVTSITGLDTINVVLSESLFDAWNIASDLSFIEGAGELLKDTSYYIYDDVLGSEDVYFVDTAYADANLDFTQGENASLITDDETGTDLTLDFLSTLDFTSTGYATALYNTGTLGEISGDFVVVGEVFSNSSNQGYAIYNTGTTANVTSSISITNEGGVAYAIYNTGSMDNITGAEISVTGFTAYGLDIASGASTGELSSKVKVTAISGSAYGVNLDGEMDDISSTSITVSGTTAYGLLSSVGSKLDGDISSSFDVDSINGTAYGLSISGTMTGVFTGSMDVYSQSSEAYGIELSGSMGDIAGTGITVSGTTVNGVIIYGGASAGELSSNVNLIATSGKAFGVYLEGDMGGISSESITVSATSVATGVQVLDSSSLNGNISSSIKVDSSNNSAYGLSVAGTITGDFTGSIEAAAELFALGIHLSGSMGDIKASITATSLADSAIALSIELDATVGTLSGTLTAEASDTAIALSYMNQETLNFGDSTTLSATGAASNYAILAYYSLTMESTGTVSMTGDLASYWGDITLSSGAYTMETASTITAKNMSITSDASLTLSGDTTFDLSDGTLTIYVDDLSTVGTLLSIDNGVSISGLDTINVVLSNEDFADWNIESELSFILDDSDALKDITYYIYEGTLSTSSDYIIDDTAFASGSELSEDNSSLIAPGTGNELANNALLQDLFSDLDFTESGVAAAATNTGTLGAIGVNIEAKSTNSSTGDIGYGLYNAGTVGILFGDITISMQAGSAIALMRQEGSSNGSIYGSITAIGGDTSYGIYNNVDSALVFANGASVSASRAVDNYAIYSTTDLTMESTGTVSMQGDLYAGAKSIALNSGSYTFDNGSATTTITADNMSIAAGASLTLSGEVNFDFSDGTLTLFVTDLSATSLDLSAVTSITGLDTINVVLSESLFDDWDIASDLSFIEGAGELLKDTSYYIYDGVLGSEDVYFVDTAYAEFSIAFEEGENASLITSDNTGDKLTLDFLSTLDFTSTGYATALYNTGTLGEISGDFVVVAEGATGSTNRGYAIYNTGTTGNVTGSIAISNELGVAYAIYNTGDMGDITGTALKATGTYAYGLCLYNFNASAGELSADVTATATSGMAYGLYLDEECEMGAISSETITAKATSNAYGVYAGSNSTMTGDISSTLDVDSSDGEAYGLSLGATIDGNFTGSMDVTSQTDKAWGILLRGSMGNIAGSGITVSGASSYGLYIYNGSSAGELSADVSATATDGPAFGVNLEGELGDISSESITATSQTAAATALNIASTATFGTISGTISAVGVTTATAINYAGTAALNFGDSTTLSATDAESNYAIKSVNSLTMNSTGTVSMTGMLNSGGDITLSSGAYTMETATTITADSMVITSNASLTLLGDTNFAFSEGTLTLYVDDLDSVGTLLSIADGASITGLNTIQVVLNSNDFADWNIDSELFFIDDLGDALKDTTYYLYDQDLGGDYLIVDTAFANGELTEDSSSLIAPGTGEQLGDNDLLKDVFSELDFSASGVAAAATNAGDLGDISANITAKGESDTSNDKGYGLYNEGTITSISGDITTTMSSGDAYGLTQKGDEASIGDISGKITASSDDKYSYAIYVTGGSVGDITGSVSATGVSATGIFATSGTTWGDISGDISASSTTGGAYGIYAMGDMGTISSDITVSSTESAAWAVTVSNAGSVNEIAGSITATVNDGTAGGIKLFGEVGTISADISATGTDTSYGILNYTSNALTFGDGASISATGAETNYAIYGNADLSLQTVNAGDKLSLTGDLSASGNITLSSGAYSMTTGSTITSDSMSIAAGASLTLSGDTSFDFSEGALTLYVEDLNAVSLNLDAVSTLTGLETIKVVLTEELFDAWDIDSELSFIADANSLLAETTYYLYDQDLSGDYLIVDTAFANGEYELTEGNSSLTAPGTGDQLSDNDLLQGLFSELDFSESGAAAAVNNTGELGDISSNIEAKSTNSSEDDFGYGLYNAGTVGALSGDITITMDGGYAIALMRQEGSSNGTISGNISAIGGDTSCGIYNNVNGSLIFGDGASVSASGAAENYAIYSSTDLTIEASAASDQVSLSGEIFIVGELNISQGIYNMETATITADSITLSDGSQLTLTIDTLINSADDTLSIKDGATLNALGSLTADALVLTEGSANLADASITQLTGDEDSSLSGSISIEGEEESSYLGSYADATSITLVGKTTATLIEGENLSIIGSAESEVTITGACGGSLNSFNSEGTVNLGEMSESLSLSAASGMVGGTLNVELTQATLSDSISSPTALSLTTGAALSMNGTTFNLTVNEEEVTAIDISKMEDKGGTLLSLSDDAASSASDIELNVTGYVFSKYFTNIRMDGVKVIADLNYNAYSSLVEGEGNHIDGIELINKALIKVNPQLDKNRESNPDLAAVLDSFDEYLKAGDSQSASATAAAVAGASINALNSALMSDVDRQLTSIRNRMQGAALGQGVVPEQGTSGFSAWVQAETAQSNLDNSAGYLSGHSYSASGGSVGADMIVSSNTVAGAAFTAMYGDVDSYVAGKSEGDLNTYYLSAYARHQAGAWNHSLVASIGMADANMDRTVSHTNGSYTAKGDTDGFAFGLNYELGYDIALKEDKSSILRPLFSASLIHSRLDGFTESGTDAGLTVSEQDNTYLTLGAGLELAKTLGSSIVNRDAQLNIRALITTDIGDRSVDADVQLSSNDSTTRRINGTETGALGFELGVGLSVPVNSKGDAVFMNINYEVRENMTEGRATLGYRFSF